jgi:hypothetical protein
MVGVVTSQALEKGAECVLEGCILHVEPGGHLVSQAQQLVAWQLLDSSSNIPKATGAEDHLERDRKHSRML